MLETLIRPEDKEERCGLVLADGELVEIANLAKDRVNSFEMDPVEVLPYLTEGTITGTWHTHPHSDPHLSGDDYASFVGWPELKHHVIGRVNNKVVVKSYEVRNGAVFECE